MGIFYKDYDAEIADASKTQKHLKIASLILGVVAQSTLIVSATAGGLLLVGGAGMTQGAAAVLAIGGLATSVTTFAGACLSSYCSRLIDYKLRYFKDKKSVQEMLKERENTPEKRLEKRRQISALKEEFKKTKLTGNESMEETLKKSEEAKKIAMLISINSEILRVSCPSRHKQARNLIAERKERQHG